MWTYTDNLTLLENLIVRSKFKDGVFQFYQIYPVDGYVLRIPTLDYTIEDLDGNTTVVQYRTWGGATELAGYDWATNPCGYCAELYDETMEVFGVDKETEKM